MEIVLHPIGIIRSPFRERHDMPIQASAAAHIEGVIELDEKYTGALKDLEDFSHIILLYYFHQAGTFKPEVVPFLDDQPHGLFATRAPNRPNPIGLSTVRLESVDGNRIKISGVDILDGTPLLDIKPYIPEMDARNNCGIGWLTHNVHRINATQSDTRFSE